MEVKRYALDDTILVEQTIVHERSELTPYLTSILTPIITPN